MPVLATRFRYVSNISTLIVTTSCTSNLSSGCRIIFTEIDIPVQVYIEDRLHGLFKKESVVRVGRHIELVSEKIALQFLEDFDFNTSSFHQEEKCFRSKIWQTQGKRRVLQLNPAYR